MPETLDLVTALKAAMDHVCQRNQYNSYIKIGTIPTLKSVQFLH